MWAPRAKQRYERASLYCLPVHAGSRPIRLSIYAIKTAKDVGRNGKAVRQICTAAILSQPCLSWVIHIAPTGSKASPNVRYAFNGDRMCASQRTDAKCQSRTLFKRTLAETAPRH